MSNQVQAPTMKNATSLSSVYTGDNITKTEVKTAIIFPEMYETSLTILADMHVNRDDPKTLAPGPWTPTTDRVCRLPYRPVLRLPPQTPFTNHPSK